MNNSHFFIAFLLCIALILTFFFPVAPALADDHCWAEYAWADCDDGNKFNGYWFRGEGFVPGMITQNSHFSPAPIHTKGNVVYYAQGVMEATARYMGLDLSNYAGGVAMMSCADIGQAVWIRRDPVLHADDWSPGSSFLWEGPFLVVDCAEWDDHYPVTVFRDEVVEMDYETAVRWGMTYPRTWNQWVMPVEVFKSRYQPPEDVGEPVDFDGWFLGHVQFYSQARIELPRRAILHHSGGHRWRIRDEWHYFLPWHREMLTDQWSGWGWGPTFYVEPWIRKLINDI